MNAGGEPVVTAVVVTFNRREVVLECLDKLLGAVVRPTHVVVVDNASSDGTAQAIRASHPDVGVIEVGENLGPAGGLERGMSVVSQQACDWIMVLDDDCFVEPDTLQRLLSVAASSDGTVGIIAPMNRGEQKDRLGYLWRHRPIPFTVPDLARGTNPVDVDMVIFNGPLFRADLVRRLGVPRGDYFFMWEEWEYCLRFRDQGFRVLAVPGCYVQHEWLGSSSPGAFPWRDYYQARNYLRFALDRRNVLDVFFWVAREAKFLAATLLYSDQKAVRIRLRLLGTFDAIRGRMGRTITPRVTSSAADAGVSRS